MTTVSVVIPTYNQAHYLPAAIESVFEQQFTDYELVVVDDGSTDKTADIIARYGSKIHQVICQENQGLAGARNSGIRAAQGDFVALLDSDDVWLPDFLSAMVDFAKQQPEAIAYYCGAYTMNADGQSLPQTLGRRQVAKEELYQSLLRTNFIIPSTVLLRRQLIIQAGLFDPDFRRLQDYELWIRLLKQGHLIAGLDSCHIRYRLHTDNLSVDASGGRMAVLALANKHFGTDDQQPEQWCADKRRAYGGAYQFCTITTLVREKDWSAAQPYFSQALYCDPTLATELDFFYELALGTQSLGYRGTGKTADFTRAAANVRQLLAETFQVAQPALLALQKAAYGTAFYALGLAAYNSGQTAACRHFLSQAVRHQPELLRNKQFAASYLKSVAKTFLDNYFLAVA